MQIKFENQSTSITDYSVYTAGTVDEVLQVNIYWTGVLGVKIRYFNQSGTQWITPSNDCPAYTIKISAHSTIYLSASMINTNSFDLYLVIQSLWEL